MVGQLFKQFFSCCDTRVCETDSLIQVPHSSLNDKATFSLHHKTTKGTSTEKSRTLTGAFQMATETRTQTGPRPRWKPVIYRPDIAHTCMLHSERSRARLCCHNGAHGAGEVLGKGSWNRGRVYPDPSLLLLGTFPHPQNSSVVRQHTSTA